MKKVAVVIGVLVILVAIVFLVGPGTIKQTVERVQPPNVEVTSHNARSGFEGLDYVVYVDVSVYNQGGPGTVTVWAEVTQGGKTFKKAQSIHLESRESRDLTLKFKEAGLLSGPITYSVWIEY